MMAPNCQVFHLFSALARFRSTNFSSLEPTQSSPASLLASRRRMNMSDHHILPGFQSCFVSWYLCTGRNKTTVSLPCSDENWDCLISFIYTALKRIALEQDEREHGNIERTEKQSKLKAPSKHRYLPLGSRHTLTGPGRKT